MRLLVPVDIAERPEEMLALAVGWAERLNGQIDLVYVDSFEYAGYRIRDRNTRKSVMAHWEKAKAENAAELDRLLGEVPEAHRGTALYLEGDPAEEVTRLAADYGAIILATHGRTGLQHLVLGSVAEKVVRLAQSPVVVLKLQR